MIRRIFSLFGLAAIVGFFLPWLKACDKVESGFELTILDSLNEFSLSSIFSLNTGLLLLLVPAFALLAAWLMHLPKAKRPLHAFFGVLAFLSFWNIGIWGGLEISAFLKEWGTPAHVHSMLMAKLSVVQILGAMFLTVFLVKWLRHKSFNFSWAVAVIVFPLFASLGMAFSIEPVYYGLWVYLISLAGLLVGSIIEAVRNKG